MHRGEVLKVGTFYGLSQTHKYSFSQYTPGRSSYPVAFRLCCPAYSKRVEKNARVLRRPSVTLFGVL